jgi:hypothetical protein
VSLQEIFRCPFRAFQRISCNNGVNERLALGFLLAFVEHRSPYTFMNGIFYRALSRFNVPVMLDQFLQELQFILRQGNCQLHGILLPALADRVSASAIIAGKGWSIFL